LWSDVLKALAEPDVVQVICKRSPHDPGVGPVIKQTDDVGVDHQRVVAKRAGQFKSTGPVVRKVVPRDLVEFTGHVNEQLPHQLLGSIGRAGVDNAPRINEWPD
jgi:hypothetical protein